MNRKFLMAMDVRCPKCHATKGQPCFFLRHEAKIVKQSSHDERTLAALEERGLKAEAPKLVEQQ